MVSLGDITRQGVDGAAQIAAVARANVAHAKLDEKVSVVQGKVEELLAAGAIPGAGTFDVLVSEWMVWKEEDRGVKGGWCGRRGC